MKIGRIQLDSPDGPVGRLVAVDQGYLVTEPGLRQHIRNAIGLGATREEIMEVFELDSGIGIEAFTLALPALRETAGLGRA